MQILSNEKIKLIYTTLVSETSQRFSSHRPSFNEPIFCEPPSSSLKQRLSSTLGQTFEFIDSAEDLIKNLESKNGNIFFMSSNIPLRDWHRLLGPIFFDILSQVHLQNCHIISSNKKLSPKEIDFVIWHHKNHNPSNKVYLVMNSDFGFPIVASDQTQRSIVSSKLDKPVIELFIS